MKVSGLEWEGTPALSSASGYVVSLEYKRWAPQARLKQRRSVLTHTRTRLLRLFGGAKKGEGVTVATDKTTK